MSTLKNLLVTVVLTCGLVGCSGTRVFTLPDEHGAFADQIEIGDEVQLVTHNGDTHGFAVTELEQSRICGPDECYDYPQVTQISVEHLSLWKTGGAAVGTLGALVLIAAASVGSVL